MTQISRRKWSLWTKKVKKRHGEKSHDISKVSFFFQWSKGQTFEKKGRNYLSAVCKKEVFSKGLRLDDRD